jgi:hypothetical protein
MSNRGLPKHPIHKRAVKQHGRKLSLRRLSAYVAASLGALILAVAVLIFLFSGAILNRYGKGKAERAFAEAHPGYALRIGELDYAVGRQSPGRSIGHTECHQHDAQGRADFAYGRSLGAAALGNGCSD